MTYFNISQWIMHVSLNLQALLGNKESKRSTGQDIKRPRFWPFLCQRLIEVLDSVTSTLWASVYPTVKCKLSIYVISQSIKESQMFIIAPARLFESVFGHFLFSGNGSGDWLSRPMEQKEDFWQVTLTGKENGTIGGPSSQKQVRVRRRS